MGITYNFFLHNLSIYLEFDNAFGHNSAQSGELETEYYPLENFSLLQKYQRPVPILLSKGEMKVRY